MKRTTPSIPDAFSYTLLRFNDLVEEMPPIDKVKSELLKLKEDAEISHELNYRQREAIIARVKNYLSGNYGNTKTEDNYNHGKPSSKKVA